MDDTDGTKAENSMPQSTNEGELAEKFADLFMDKISKIRKTLEYFSEFQAKCQTCLSFRKLRGSYRD